jgi:cytochrome P450
MQRRRMITPTFHFDILKSYLPIINEHTDILIQLLENKVNLEEEIDAFEIMNLTTLDIICG